MAKITICGDFTTEGRGLSAVKLHNAFSTEIVSLLSLSDCSIVNLEAPVVDGTAQPIQKVGPNIRTTSDSVHYLANSGVNILTVANNHIYDYGKEGFKTTISAIKESGMDYVGTYSQRFLVKNVANEKIAILNCCENEFSTLQPAASPWDIINIYHDIQEVKTQGCYVIVIVHGGHEGYEFPSPRMKRLYRFMIDLGANVVVNHHQHCYSGYEHYNGGIVFYGLGNLFFDILNNNPAKELWHDGYMVELSIQDNMLKDYSLHAYRQCLPESASVRLMYKEEEEIFKKKLDYINRVIGNDELLNMHFESFVKKVSRFQLSGFSPYSNRILLMLYRKHLVPSFLNRKRKLQLLNLLRCESHRDLTISSLLYYAHNL